MRDKGKTVMNWIEIKNLPEDQQWCWVSFAGGAKIACRMLAGTLCWYNVTEDKFYQIDGWKNSTFGAKYWIPLPDLNTEKVGHENN